MKRDNLTPEEQITIDYYNTHADEWRVKHEQVGKFGKLEPEFKLLFKLLPKGKVIEIGTGAGEDAQNLIKHYGLTNYIGIEPAQGLRKIAIENNPGGNFISSSIYEVSKLEGKFDGFWLCQMLIHIPKKRIPETLKAVKSVLNPKSIGMISILEGNLDWEESRPGRFYSLWTDEEFSKVLVENGFEIVHQRRLETGHSPWLVYIVRKI